MQNQTCLNIVEPLGANSFKMSLMTPIVFYIDQLIIKMQLSAKFKKIMWRGFRATLHFSHI